MFPVKYEIQYDDHEVGINQMQKWENNGFWLQG